MGNNLKWLSEILWCALSITMFSKFKHYGLTVSINQWRKCVSDHAPLDFNFNLSYTECQETASVHHHQITYDQHCWRLLAYGVWLEVPNNCDAEPIG